MLCSRPLLPLELEAIRPFTVNAPLWEGARGARRQAGLGANDPGFQELAPKAPAGRGSRSIEQRGETPWLLAHMGAVHCRSKVQACLHSPPWQELGFQSLHKATKPAGGPGWVRGRERCGGSGQ